MKSDPRHHKLKVQKTAHYYTLGDEYDKVEELWIAFHGYGQRADRFIQKWNQIDLTGKLIVAPEGLNKFYWHESPRDPVATWMTKADRLDEIQDYLSWIDQLYDSLLERLPDARLCILGFSQGASTAWRWLLHRRCSVDTYIHWAGDFPPELQYCDHQDYLDSIKKYFVVGDQDQFFKQGAIDRMRSFMIENKLNMTEHIYNGTHRIDRDVLRALMMS